MFIVIFHVKAFRTNFHVSCNCRGLLATLVGHPYKAMLAVTHLGEPQLLRLGL